MTGRLGQRHADILEAIMFCAERRKDENDGIRLLIDPAEVRKVMGEHHSQAGNLCRYSLEQCWTLLKELTAANVDVDAPGKRISGGIVAHHEYTKSITKADPLTGGHRRLWTVKLGKAWVELMKLDMIASGNPAPIARLEHGITKAVARFMLTHSPQHQPNGGWTLDRVIEAVAGELDTTGMKNARRHLRAEARALRGLGIEIDGSRVRLVSQPPDLVSQPPGGVTAAHGPLGISGSLEPEQAALAAAQAQAQPP